MRSIRSTYVRTVIESMTVSLFSSYPLGVPLRIGRAVECWSFAAVAVSRQTPGSDRDLKGESSDRTVRVAARSSQGLRVGSTLWLQPARREPRLNVSRATSS